MASRAPKGSSSRMISGLPASARAIATLWRWPPERSLGQRPPKRPAGSPTRSRASRARSPGVRLPSQPRNQGSVAQHGPMGEQPTFLLHIADAAAQLNRIECIDCPSSDLHRTGVGPYHGVETAQQRGLPGSTLADQRQAGASRDVQRNAVEGDRRAVALDDLAHAQRRRCVRGTHAAPACVGALQPHLMLRLCFNRGPAAVNPVKRIT